jgi:NADH:ubiquinone oxidoreductase subunit 6 (subunit J)
MLTPRQRFESDGPSSPREFLLPTAIWIAAAGAFVCGNAYIGAVMVTLIFVLWQLSVAMRLPNGPSHALLDWWWKTRTGAVLRFVFFWTLIIGTIVSVVTGY